MDADHSRPGLHLEKGGNVTETHKPLGMGFQLAELKLADKADGPVTSSVADNSLNRRIFESPADVRKTFLGGSGVLAEVFLAHIWPDDRLEAPGADHVRRAVDFFHGHRIRRRNQRHLVAR